MHLAQRAREVLAREDVEQAVLRGELDSPSRSPYGSDISPSVTSSGIATATSASPAMKPEASGIE